MTNLPCIQKQQRLFAGYYHQSSPCSLLHLCLISRLSDVVLFFFCTREQVSVFAFTLWGLFAEGLRHTQKFLTYLPHHHAKFCSMFSGWQRQTDRQTGTKGPRPKVDPLWGMATLVRHSNKKWSPGPPARLERRRLKVLSVWETGPSMSKPFIALASYCFSLLGG